MSPHRALGRRQFLRLGAVGAGGWLVAFRLPLLGEPASGELLAGAAVGAADPASAARLNAWIHIAPDDTVTLAIHMAEMGQGTVTSLSMLLAEELACDWRTIKTEFPGIDPAFGSSQGVFGSRSIRSSWRPLRQAGATARDLLVRAAAAEWQVDPASCRAEHGAVLNPATGARRSYGALAVRAAALPPASTPPALKDPSAFTVIGKPLKRLDTPSKVDGSATFGIDVRLPGMLYAVIARCPVFGGTVGQVDDTKAKAVAGVRQILPMSSGIAVIADNTWSAMEGRRLLDITWNEGPNVSLSSDGLTAMSAALVGEPGVPAKTVGDAAGTIGAATHKIEAVYQVPFLAHAPMEPLNCTADVRSDGCDVWASTQGQSAALQIAMQKSGLPREQVQVHTLYMGGGFGRRTAADYIGEAVEISKAVSRPVKLTWSRPDDTKHDRFRPTSYVKLAGCLDAAGWPVALSAKVVCPQFSGAGTAVEGLATVPYDLPHLFVESHNLNVPIPTHFWRSVGYSQNTFFAESFLDELAALGGKDPLEVRRRLLGSQPRMLAALDLAAKEAGWGTPLPAGHGRGIAIVNNIGSFTAQVAEVSVAQGTVRVHRVVCAVDCGHVVNPAIVAQQVRGGIIYGLSAALKGAITIDRGRVNESSFSDYDVVRMPEAPVIDVHIVPSTANPGGMGEAAVPGIAPAVANALYAAAGLRARRLPFKMEELTARPGKTIR